MKASQKAFLMQCLSAIAGALGICTIALGIAELISCSTMGHISRGFMFLVIGMLSFVLVCKFFKRSHTFYWEAVEQNQQHERGNIITQAMAQPGGVNFNTGNGEWRENMTQTLVGTLPHDVRPSDRERSIGRSRRYSASLGEGRGGFYGRGGVDGSQYYMAIDYADRIGTDRSVSNEANTSYAQLQHRFEELRMQQAMMNPPQPIVVAQQENANEGYTFTFNVLKNREIQQDNKKEIKEEEPIKRTVLNAISDLELDD